MIQIKTAVCTCIIEAFKGWIIISKGNVPNTLGIQHFEGVLALWVKLALNFTVDFVILGSTYFKVLFLPLVILVLVSEGN